MAVVAGAENILRMKLHLDSEGFKFFWEFVDVLTALVFHVKLAIRYK